MAFDDLEDSKPHYPPPGHSPPSSDPPPPLVLHIHHPTHHYTHTPYSPTVIHHHSHQSHSPFSNKAPTVKVYTKANPNYSLAIRDGKVVLVPSDPDDPAQHWFKDEKYSTKIRDEEGNPCFALVNKATGQAMRHSFDTDPVRLTCFDPNDVDGSILWTQSKELEGGYITIRMVNNVRLIVDAFRGNKDYGGVHDGTPVGLWKWNEGENQLWKIVPYYN